MTDDINNIVNEKRNDNRIAQAGALAWQSQKERKVQNDNGRLIPAIDTPILASLGRSPQLMNALWRFKADV